MKCPNCGAINSNQAKFCGKCGILLVENQKIEETKPQKTSNVTIEESENKETQSINKSDGGNGALFIGCCCLSIIILAVIGML